MGNHFRCCLDFSCISLAMVLLASNALAEMTGIIDEGFVEVDGSQRSQIDVESSYFQQDETEARFDFMVSDQVTSHDYGAVYQESRDGYHSNSPARPSVRARVGRWILQLIPSASVNRAHGVVGMTIECTDGITGPTGLSLFEKVSHQYRLQRERMFIDEPLFPGISP